MKYKNKYRPMSAADRAAQFAPFAALSGYEEMIEEKIRQVEEGCDVAYKVEEDKLQDRGRLNGENLKN